MYRTANRSIPAVAARGIDAEGYGSLSTRSTPHGINRGGYQTGRLPHRLASIMRERADSIVQVIYSYGTPIAWLDAGAWIIPDVSYSVTTAKHQGHLWSLSARVSVPADVSLTGYMRLLNGQDVYAHGKLYSPRAADPAFRAVVA